MSYSITNTFFKQVICQKQSQATSPPLLPVYMLRKITRCLLSCCTTCFSNIDSYTAELQCEKEMLLTDQTPDFVWTVFITLLGGWEESCCGRSSNIREARGEHEDVTSTIMHCSLVSCTACQIKSLWYSPLYSFFLLPPYATRIVIKKLKILRFQSAAGFGEEENKSFL